MFLALALLIFALLFFGIGFIVHLLWIVAAVAIVVWIIGFFVRHEERHWYHW
jgi:protein-S-isoprenylcysteine O-methyltransferase Ste14